MLGFPDNTRNEQRCEITHGVMGHLDLKEPPSKRKPFSTILNYQLVHKIEFVLPEEVYEIIQNDYFKQENTPVYSRVILPLAALLEEDFFNQYIKIGNILMLSEGNSGVENVYSLKEGILTLHLDKESYERAGLAGRPEGAKGKRGTKPRWIVEINLRLPSMLHGKKGFDRISYAFKKVLTTPVTWLFHDLTSTALTPDPLDIHFPVKKTIIPQISRDIQVNLPHLRALADVDRAHGGDFEDYAVELQEWLALLLLESPRVDPNDRIDSYLCRYVPPGDSSTSDRLVKVTWQGFLSSSWAHKSFVQILSAVPQKSWFAFCVGGFEEGWSGEVKNCTILKFPDAQNEYILWDVV